MSSLQNINNLNLASTSFENVFCFDRVVGLDLGSDFGFGSDHGFDFALDVDFDDDHLFFDALSNNSIFVVECFFFSRV